MLSGKGRAREIGPTPAGAASAAGLAWRESVLHGGPILAEVAAHLVCRRERHIEIGDHMLLIGEVLAFERSATRPLIFHQGAYRAVA